VKSKVYFVRTASGDSVGTVNEKLSALVTKSAILKEITAKDKVVIKIHFGEEGNTGFVRPEYVKTVTGFLPKNISAPIISDTNTLYKGRRTNSRDHRALALEHGFTLDNTGCEVVIPDDTVPGNVEKIGVNGEFIKQAKVARLFIDADVLINIAHFKGHLMTGFGGALKNIGMGCASREGKLEQHTDISPVVYRGLCTACGTCLGVCPVDAITIASGEAVVDKAKCIGCATCIAACPVEAMGVPWESGGGIIQEKMAEYAKAVLGTRAERGKKTIHMNFTIKITKECDCLAKDDPRITPDIGILASADPVSLEKATRDIVLASAGKDIFREVHPKRDGMKQLIHATKLGLGSLEYELSEIG
jgi:uncharacterized Fe-S center protein